MSGFPHAENREQIIQLRRQLVSFIADASVTDIRRLQDCLQHQFLHNWTHRTDIGGEHGSPLAELLMLFHVFAVCVLDAVGFTDGSQVQVVCTSAIGPVMRSLLCLPRQLRLLRQQRQRRIGLCHPRTQLAVQVDMTREERVYRLLRLLRHGCHAFVFTSDLSS